MKDYRKKNPDYEYTLRRVANRDAVPQFFDGNYDESCQYYNGREEVSNQDFLGLILDYKDGYALIEERNYFKQGDTVQVFGPNLETKTFIIEEIFDENKEKIEIVRHPKQLVWVKIPVTVSKYDMMRIKI